MVYIFFISDKKNKTLYYSILIHREKKYFFIDYKKNQKITINKKLDKTIKNGIINYRF